MISNEKRINELNDLCSTLQNAIDNNTDENGLTFLDYKAIAENRRLDNENLKALLLEMLNDNDIDIEKYSDRISDLI